MFYILPEDVQGFTFQPELQQGDIVAPLPFVGFQIDRTQVPASDGRVSLEDFTLSPRPAEGMLVATYILQRCVVASQTCD